MAVSTGQHRLAAILIKGNPMKFAYSSRLGLILTAKMRNRLIRLAGLTGLLLAGTAMAAGLRVVPGVAEYDADGFVRISGEIHNETGQTVCAARVEVFLKDAAGKPITVTSIVTETKAGLGQEPSDGVVATREWLPGGEVAVFSYLRDLKKLGGAKPASHEIRASARQCEGALPTIVVDEFKDKTDSAGDHALSGVLRNSGNVPCRSPKIVLGLYDANARLLDADYVQPDEFFQKKLAPGKMVRFGRNSLSSPAWGKLVSFKYWGDCASHEP